MKTSSVASSDLSNTLTHKIHWIPIRSPLFIGAFFVVLISVWVTYHKHFDNPFYFDDDHTVVTNRWVRQVDSFPKFFKDATTTSSLPRNQAYRPGMTVLHGIDYALGLDTTSKAALVKYDSLKKVLGPIAAKEAMLRPQQKIFHIHIFMGYLLSGVLLFFVLLHLFGHADPHRTWIHWLALFGMAWFLLHTANAETINYISARSDAASTFWILLSLVVYFYSAFARRFFLFLIPMIIGFFIKEPAIMVAPILLVYVWIFGAEEKPLRQTKNIIVIGVSCATAIVLFLISRSFTPTTWSSGGTDPWHYLLTQAFVIVHYCFNFILPVNLSADTDWAPVQNTFDDRVLLGTLFIAALFYVIVRCWNRPKWRLVSFGLVWFFMALAPTSSVFPFAEVLNDHRTYFPYIGLIIAACCALANVFDRLTISRQKMVFAAAGIFLILHGVGAYQRTMVWSSPETLWGDCVRKSPANGRAWMHYGMAMFERGKQAGIRKQADSTKYWYDSTEFCYNRAQVLIPYYSYLFVNWGVLREWQQRFPEAEEYYRYALSCDNSNPEVYAALGDFLFRKNRPQEAYPFVQQGLQLSPDHQRLNNLSRSLQQANPYKQLAFYQAQKTADLKLNDYLNWSLVCYNIADYDGCILAARQALKIDSLNVVAHNNICTANNQLGDYNAAIDAGKQALRVDAKFVQAVANLNEALRCKTLSDSLYAALPPEPTDLDYVNLSLTFYNAKMYAATIDAASKAVRMNPGNASAWNNICVACNQLKRYQQGREAGEKALALDPKFELAKNNLEVSVNGLKQAEAMREGQ
jgi:protein O-mannosyl-transferase